MKIVSREQYDKGLESGLFKIYFAREGDFNYVEASKYEEDLKKGIVAKLPGRKALVDIYEWQKAVEAGTVTELNVPVPGNEVSASMYEFQLTQNKYFVFPDYT